MIVFCGPAIFDGDNTKLSTRPASEQRHPDLHRQRVFSEEITPEYFNALLGLGVRNLRFANDTSCSYPKGFLSFSVLPPRDGRFSALPCSGLLTEIRMRSRRRIQTDSCQRTLWHNGHGRVGDTEEISIALTYS